MNDGRKDHWERVYGTRQSTDVSWYQPVPTRSLALLDDAGVGPATALIDVGGGDSTLVDALLDRGFGALTVLDLSGAALARARERVGARADDITWIEADITRAELPTAGYGVWHDRAVFHFLTETDDRARYVATAAASVKPGGMMILATFALDGPTRCSGLDVARYSTDTLAAEFSEAFVLQRGLSDEHTTPSGTTQRFTIVVMTRRDNR
jgi:SAM-dependent methyltransferase